MIWAAPAMAATPVIHGGPADRALAGVSADAGVAAAEMTAMKPEELVGEGAVVLVGRGQPPGCDGGAGNNAVVTRRLDEFEARRASGDAEGAAAAWERAAGMLYCLVEPAEPEMVDRFVALRSEGYRGPARLIVGPGVALAGPLWVDGRLAQPVAGMLALTEGEHLVQVLGTTVTTLRVDLRDGTPTALVVPAEVNDTLAARAGDPLTREVIGAMLDGKGLGAAWVWTGTRTWQRGAEWTLLPSARASAGRDQDIGRALLIAGLAGVAFGASSLAGGLALAGAPETEAAGLGLAYAGAAVGGAGLLCAGVAVPLVVGAR